MTRPNLFKVKGKYYSIHTYANEFGVSLHVARKRLHRMAFKGVCKFVRRNDSNWKIVNMEYANNFIITLREFLDEAVSKLQ